MESHNNKTPHKNFFLHVWEVFLAQPLPTKLFIIAVTLMVLAIPALLSPILVKAEERSITLRPTDDAHVNRSNKRENYGTDREVKSDRDRIGYMKFNLSSLATQPITRAELRLYVTESSKIDHYVKNVSDTSWNEDSLTYANSPARSAQIATISKPKEGRWITIDVTTDVTAHLGHEWSIAIENPSGKSDSMHFYSKDNRRNKPELIIYLAGDVLPTPNVTQVPTITNTPVPPSVTPTTVISGTVTPTRTPTPSRTPTPVAPTPTNVPPGQATLPSQVLNLTNWKLTLPTGPSEHPTEILQPTLATYSNDPWFVVNSERNGVRFRASVNGVSTSGSGYPRSELREMDRTNNRALASWSSTSGIHIMFLEEAITAVPQKKKHVVAGQIHDSGDDVIVIRLEYPKLFIDINGNDGPVLDANYTLGKRFTVKFEVSNGQTKIYYNNSTTPAYTLNKSYSGAYFKAGAYTQSNCGTEDSSGCNADNYGEVVIYRLYVTHQ